MFFSFLHPRDAFFLTLIFLLIFIMKIFFTFWQGFLIEVLHSFGVLGEIGDWDSEHVVDGLQVSYQPHDFIVLSTLGNSFFTSTTIYYIIISPGFPHFI